MNNLGSINYAKAQLSKRYQFKKGDNVPEWIFTHTGVKKITFETNVDVYRHMDRVEVYPQQDLGTTEHVIFITPIDSGVEMHVNGAPTFVFNNPLGSVDNLPVNVPVKG